MMSYLIYVEASNFVFKHVVLPQRNDQHAFITYFYSNCTAPIHTYDGTCSNTALKFDVEFRLLISIIILNSSLFLSIFACILFTHDYDTRGTIQIHHVTLMICLVDFQYFYN